MAAPSIEATTIARVKDILKITDATDDAELTTLVQAVSSEVEAYIDNPLKVQTFTEEYDVPKRARHIWLGQTPVTVITTIKNDLDWDWAAADPLVVEDDYHADLKVGHIFFDYLLDPGFRALQVVYDAGLAADTAALIVAAPNLVHAVDIAVVNEWNRKKSPGSTGRSTGGNRQTWEGALSLPKRSIELLGPYRNRTAVL